MPSNYTGDGAAIAPRTAPVIACPVDADPANAASVNTPLQQLADVVDYLQDHAALLDQINAFTAANSFAALVTLLGLAGDANKVLVSSPAVTLRKCLWEISAGGAGQKARIYLTVDGQLEITRNAYWDTATSKWRADLWSAGSDYSCSLVTLTGTGLQGYAYGDAANDLTNVANAWTNATWVPVADLGANGAIKFFGTEAGTATDSNPAASDAQTNRLCAKNTPKAWATVAVDAAGAVTVVDGFNLAYQNQTASAVRLNLGGDMASADYAALVQTDRATYPRVVAKHADYFDVEFLSFSTGLVQAITTGSAYLFDIIVFGRQDS